MRALLLALLSLTAWADRAQLPNRFAAGPVAIDLPADWFPAKFDDHSFALLAPLLDHDFKVYVGITLSKEAKKLDEYVDQLRTEGTIEKIKWMGGEARQFVVPQPDQGMKSLMRCMFVDGELVMLQGAAPAASFDKHRATFKKVFDSLARKDAAAKYHPPLFTTLLVPEERHGEDRPENRTWLFEKAAQKKDAFDAKLKAHILAHDDTCRTKVVPQYGAAYLPLRLVIDVECKSGTKFHESIENLP